MSGQNTCKSCDGIGFFQDARGQSSCKPISTCPAGRGEVAPPTATTDRVCGLCELGKTFAVAGNTAPCQTASLCPAGTQLEQAPTTSSDRRCSPCPAFTFNPTPGENPTCRPIRSCSDSEWMTREFTASSDRQCTQVLLCKNGRLDGTSVPCSCPSSDRCSECLIQSSAPPGLLLVQDGGTPRVSASLDPDNPVQFIPDNIEPLAGCRDLCLANTACNSFFVHVAGESRGACFLKRSYTVTRGLDFTPGTFYYALSTCTKCQPGFFIKDRSCVVEALSPVFARAYPASI